MTQRKYSIDEIDQMRAALALLGVRVRYTPNFNPKTGEYVGRTGHHMDIGGSNESKRAAVVEDRLRTHMVNGTDPEDLKMAAQRQRDKESLHTESVSFAYEVVQYRAAFGLPTPDSCPYVARIAADKAKGSP
ncbi:MAG: hypothetical protein ACKVS5_02685 [Parvularculaceae bacterium]